MTPMPSLDQTTDTGQPTPPPSYSTATRHLCAAAHIDDAFWLESLREVYYQSNRAVAPSYGFQLLPVLWHCLRARNMWMARHAAVVAILLGATCFSFPTFVWLVPVLVWVAAMVALGRVLENTVRRLRSNYSLTPLVSELMRLFALITGGVVVAFALTHYVFTSIPAMLQGAIGTGPWRLLETAPSVPGIALICMLAISPIIGHRLWQQRQLAQLAPRSRVNHPRQSRRFESIHQQQQGNTVVYSNRNPFIGSGVIIHKGCLAGRLVRPSNNFGPLQRESAREFDQAPFTAEQVITHVARQLRSLAADSDPERQIPGLTVKSLIFKAGTEVGRLSTVTDQAALAEVIQNPTSPARHYLLCQVVSWRGELVTSIYVHFAVQGQSLYLEMITTALPPCDDRFRIVDLIDGTGPLAYLRSFGQSLVGVPKAVLAAPFRLVLMMADLLTDTITRTAGTPVSPTRQFDYGARVSVRELGASEGLRTSMFRDTMQRQDVEKYARIVQRKVVASMLDFLNERGVDATELVEHAKTYFNYFASAMHWGSGAINAENVIGQQYNPSIFDPRIGQTPGPPAGTAS